MDNIHYLSIVILGIVALIYFVFKLIEFQKRTMINLSLSKRNSMQYSESTITNKHQDEVKSLLNEERFANFIHVTGEEFSEDDVSNSAETLSFENNSSYDESDEEEEKIFKGLFTDKIEYEDPEMSSFSSQESLIVECALNEIDQNPQFERVYMEKRMSNLVTCMSKSTCTRLDNINNEDEEYSINSLNYDTSNDFSSEDELFFVDNRNEEFEVPSDSDDDDDAFNFLVNGLKIVTKVLLTLIK